MRILADVKKTFDSKGTLGVFEVSKVIELDRDGGTLLGIICNDSTVLNTGIMSEDDARSMLSTLIKEGYLDFTKQTNQVNVYEIKSKGKSRCGGDSCYECLSGGCNGLDFNNSEYDDMEFEFNDLMDNISEDELDDAIDEFIDIDVKSFEDL